MSPANNSSKSPHIFQITDRIFESIPERMDPYRKLIAAMLINALKDLGGQDPLEFLDSLDWLINSESAPIFLEALGLSRDGLGILRSVLGGICMNAKIKNGPYLAELRKELGNMDDNQLGRFRELLKAIMPSFLQELAIEARQPNRKNSEIPARIIRDLRGRIIS